MCGGGDWVPDKMDRQTDRQAEWRKNKMAYWCTYDVISQQDRDFISRRWKEDANCIAIAFDDRWKPNKKARMFLRLAGIFSKYLSICYILRNFLDDYITTHFKNKLVLFYKPIYRFILCVCVCVQVLDKIIKTPGNFKQISFNLFTDCSPPVKSSFMHLPSHSF